jgi:sulfide:quinone oxidoreductase
MTRTPDSAPLEVVIAGAGVAGLETMMALRALAGPRTAITLVAPNVEFAYRPLSVAEPFGSEPSRTYPLDTIARDFGATHLQDELAWVGAGSQRLFLSSGDELGYDALVVALGARSRAAWPHVPTFNGQRDVPMARELVNDIESGEVQSIALAVPTGTTWPFPLYELALLLAARSREVGTTVQISVFTPEAEPLGVFGDEASAEVARLLAEAGVRVASEASVEITLDNGVILPGQTRPETFDRILAVPRLDGPAPRGLPCDDDGFLSIDSHGRVLHVQHVYAAGDGADYPVKQGGIATQQANTVAEVIAQRAGAHVDPRPLRPVLRGHLLANGSSRFLRAELHSRDGEISEASANPMWWPATKIAGTYLSPYLAAL